MRTHRLAIQLNIERCWRHKVFNRPTDRWIGWHRGDLIAPARERNA